MGNDKIRGRTYKEVMEECLSDARIDANSQRQTGRKQQGARDAAILALGYTVGLKPGEIRRLKPEHYTSESLTERRSASLTIPGRREGSREVPLVGHPKKITRFWDKTRQSYVEHFFYPMSKRGQPCGDQLTQEALHKMVGRRFREADIYGPPPNPRKLRRSFKEILQEEGTKAAIRRDLLGLASRRTTERDDNTANQKMKEALESVADKAAPDARIPRPSGPIL